VPIRFMINSHSGSEYASWRAVDQVEGITRPSAARYASWNVRTVSSAK
jgi:hypothetical protein